MEIINNLELSQGIIALNNLSIPGDEPKKHELKNHAQTVLTMGLKQITKFAYRLDGPLGEGNV
jgi:hypothetical protein